MAPPGAVMLTPASPSYLFVEGAGGRYLVDSDLKCKPPLVIPIPSFLNSTYVGPRDDQVYCTSRVCVQIPFKRVFSSRSFQRSWKVFIPGAIMSIPHPS